MDSRRQPARKDAKRKREEETVEIPSTSKSPRLDVSSRAGRNSTKKSTKTQKATNSKKGKKQQMSKVSADSESSLEFSENQANFTESLQFVWKESRRCQVCSKSYDKVDKAHECFLSHKNSFAKSKFRCYLCFGIFKDTEMLFEHYRSEHSHPEGVENTLLCNCCDKKLTYKNVSVHMISSHAVPPMPENYNLKVNSENLEEKYKDEAWRYEQAKKCQGCSKTFLIIPAALECIQRHRLLRCYFCFSTFNKTDNLFEHYKLSHGQGKRMNTVKCEFCSESVTHKAAVNHVINCHLSKVI